MNATINFKIDKLPIIFFAAFVLLTPRLVEATSGACSWHLGVNCNVGADWDGSVVCNDGWRDSNVKYTLSCENNETSCPRYVASEYYYYLLNEINAAIDRVKESTASTCLSFLQTDTNRTNQLYSLCLSYNQSMETIAMRSGSEPMNLRDCEAEKSENDVADNRDYQLCLSSDDLDLLNYETLKTCMVLDTFDYCSLDIPNSITTNGSCVCKAGYSYNSSYTACVKDVICPDLVNGFILNGECYCYSGYRMGERKTCEKVEIETTQSMLDERQRAEELVTEVEIVEESEVPNDDDQINVTTNLSVEGTNDNLQHSAPETEVRGDYTSSGNSSNTQETDADVEETQKDATTEDDASTLSREVETRGDDELTGGNNWVERIFRRISNWFNRLKFW